jgi:RNA polymerase III RPC4
MAMRKRGLKMLVKDPHETEQPKEEASSHEVEEAEGEATGPALVEEASRHSEARLLDRCLQLQFVVSSRYEQSVNLYLIHIAGRRGTYKRSQTPRGISTDTGPIDTERIKRETSDIQDGAATAASATSVRSKHVIMGGTGDELSSESSDSGSDSEDGPGTNLAYIDRESDDEAITPFATIRLEHRQRSSQATTKAEALELKSQQDDNEAVSEAQTNTLGNSKLNDAETPRVARSWHGVFPEDELDAAMGLKPQVKPHPEQPETQPHIQEEPVITSTSQAAQRDNRQKPAGWQTQEQEEEWERTVEMMNNVVKVLAKPKVSQPTQLGSADMMIDEPEVEDPKKDKVYLFQFPSVMPPLVSSSDMATMSLEEKQEQISEWTSSIGRESEESQPTPFVDNRPKHLPVSGGKVGKLRVYKSGRTEIDWGGLPFELKMGIYPEFIQEAILVDNREEMGDAFSFGVVKEKFVVVPDLAQFFAKTESEEE